MGQSGLQLVPLFAVPANCAGTLSDAVTQANVATGSVTGAGGGMSGASAFPLPKRKKK